MNPLPEDKVTFRIATDVRGKRAGGAVGTATAQHAGRRAVEACTGSLIRAPFMRCYEKYHNKGKSSEDCVWTRRDTPTDEPGFMPKMMKCWTRPMCYHCKPSLNPER